MNNNEALTDTEIEIQRDGETASERRMWDTVDFD